MTTEATFTKDELDAALLEFDGDMPEPRQVTEEVPVTPVAEPAAAPVAAPVALETPAEEELDPIWGERDENGTWRLRKTDHKFLRNKTEHQIERAMIQAQEGINKRNERIRELEAKLQQPGAVAPQPVAPVVPVADPYAERYAAMQSYRWTEPEKYDRDLMNLAAERAAEMATERASQQFRQERHQEQVASVTERIRQAGYAVIERAMGEYGIDESQAQRAAATALQMHVLAGGDPADLVTPDAMWEALESSVIRAQAKPIVAATVTNRAVEPPGPKKAAAAAPAKQSANLTDRMREDLALMSKGLKDPDGFMNGVATRFASNQ